MAQYGLTPLHRAAQCGKEIAIKALLTAKADVHAKTDVRVGEGGRPGLEGKGDRRAGVCMLLWWSEGLNLRLLEDPVHEPSTQT